MKSYSILGLLFAVAITGAAFLPSANAQNLVYQGRSVFSTQGFDPYDGAWVRAVARSQGITVIGNQITMQMTVETGTGESTTQPIAVRPFAVFELGVATVGRSRVRVFTLEQSIPEQFRYPDPDTGPDFDVVGGSYYCILRLDERGRLNRATFTEVFGEPGPSGPVRFGRPSRSTPAMFFAPFLTDVGEFLFPDSPAATFRQNAPSPGLYEQFNQRLVLNPNYTELVAGLSFEDAVNAIEQLLRDQGYVPAP